MRVKLETPVDTKTAHAGDGVEATLIEPISLRGEVALPAGTFLSGRVAAVQAADKKQKRVAWLRLAFDAVTLPEGRALPAAAILQSLGLSEDVDSEGVVTQPGVSKGEAIGVTATGAAAGAGIGAAAGGGKGAGEGAAIGAAVGALSAWAASSLRWENIELKKGRKLWLRLNQELVISFPGGDVPSEPGPPAETPSRSAEPPAESPADSAATATNAAAVGRSDGPRVFLADKQSWETSGGFPLNAPSAAGSQRGALRPAPQEFLSAFRERCPVVIVTTVLDRAGYVATLDHSTWHSPNYRIEVFSRDGDAVFSGGAALLRNAVKNACNAITQQQR